MIVFGSRGSDLALTQTRWVAERIRQATGEDYRIEVMVTTGDRIQDRPLSGIGVKGLFTKELEDALRNGAIDAAVHSLKDLPVEDPDGLALGAVPAREDARDVLVTRADVLDGDGGPFGGLRAGATLGTSSPRRALAAIAARRDLRTRDIRGNVPTRVDKARNGDYDAVLLAAAGLNRLGQDLSGLVTEHLPVDVFTPAPGQGALGVQCRAGDARILGALAHLHDDTTARCVAAERAILLGLGGGCSMPLGVLVEPVGDRFRLRAALFGGEPNAALREAVIGDDPAAMAQEIVARWKPLVGDPLRGRRVATIRPDGERTGLTAALAIAGADVTSLPWTTTEAVDVTREQLEAAIGRGALAFTSARAVRRFVAACREHDVQPFELPCYAVGAATATELVQAGFAQVHGAAGRGGEQLARLCAEAGVRRVAFPCAVERHASFESRARAAGIDTEALPVYRLVDAERDAGEIPDALDAFLFTSPSAVEAWHAATDGRADVRAIAIGTTTTDALHARGFESVTTLPEPTVAALLDALSHGPTA
jgi:hydroxymethylbilane synthase